MFETTTAPPRGADLRSRAVTFLRGPAGRPALLGVLGSALITLASPGAGSLRLSDPFLERLHLSWMRFGHGQQLSMALLYLGVGLMLLAWVRVGRLVLAERISANGLRATIAAWVLPMLVASPIYSRDVYSYLAQGALLRDGFDPYAVGPVVSPGPLLDNVSSIWSNTPAPYGPVWLLVADGVTRVTGDSVVWGTLLIRLTMLPGLALLVWALPRLAGHLGGRAGAAVWLGAMNPLVLVHLVGGVHNEMLMVGLMAAGVALALDRQHAAGIAVIALAVGVKASAGLALPFVVWIWVAHLREDHARRTGTDATTTLPLLPLLVRTSAAGVGVFTAVFAAASLVAGVGIGWLTALSGSSKIVNWLSAPTAVAQLVGPATSWLTGYGSDRLLPVTRLIFGAVLAVVLVVVWWRSRRTPTDAVRGVAVALIAVVVLSPAALPWYYSWPLAFLAPLAWSPRALGVLAGVSTWLLLIFRPPGNMGLYSPFDLLVGTGVAVLVAVSLVRADPLHLRSRPATTGPDLSRTVRPGHPQSAATA